MHRYGYITQLDPDLFRDVTEYIFEGVGVSDCGFHGNRRSCQEPCHAKITPLINLALLKQPVRIRQ